MRKWELQYCTIHSNVCINGLMSYINLIFFVSAVVFYLFNWLFSIHGMSQLIRFQNRSLKIYKVLLIMIQSGLFLLLLSMCLTAWVFKSEFDVSVKYYGYLVSIMFIIIAFAFSLVGYFYYK